MADNTELLQVPEIAPTPSQSETNTDPLAALKSPGPSAPIVMPSGVPINLEVNKQLQGDYNTGPNPGAKPANLKNGTGDYIKSLVDHMSNTTWTVDPNKYGKTSSYGSGDKTKDFDRYYNHPKFKELGFNPYRDNETHYNENSSWWDDFGRMRGQFLGLAWTGAKSVWGDEITAHQEMEKRMNIGASTRDGFGGWMTNFGNNMGYTVGIMGEMAVENAAIAAAEALTFGTATPELGALAVERNTLSFGRLAKSWAGINDFMKSLKNVETAKQFFNAAKVGEKTKDFANWITPMSEFRDFAKNAYSGTKGYKDLSAVATTAKGFSSFYKGVREINLAHSEARLEGEGAADKYQQQLTDEYYAEHGHMAEGQDAEDIYQRAQTLKSTVTLANDATIFYSNKLVFENLLNGVVPGAKAAKAALKGSGQMLESVAAKGYKVGQGAVKIAEKSAVRKTADFLLKSEYSPISRKYFLGNLGEALQESAQDVISESAMMYYDKIHKDPINAGFYNTMQAVGQGTANQFTGQGLDTFLSGYLMGAVIQGGSAPITRLGDVIQAKYKGTKTEHALGKEQEEKRDLEETNAINTVAKHVLLYGDHNATMAASLKSAAEQARVAGEKGDKKAAKDMQDELQITHLETVASAGRMNILTEHVDGMMNLNDDELVSAYDNPTKSDGTPLSGSDIRQKLQTFKERAEGYQRKYEQAHIEKANPWNPWMYAAKNKDGELKFPEQFQAEMARYQAHESILSNIVFATEEYANVAQRMTDIGNNLAGRGNKLQNLMSTFGMNKIAAASGTDMSLMIDPMARGLKIQSLKSQIDTIKLGTPEQQKQLPDLEEQYKLLNQWNQHVDHFVKEMASDKKAMISPEEATARAQATRVQPGATVVNKKDGTEYKVKSLDRDRAIVVNKKGEEKSISRRELTVTKDAKTAKPLEHMNYEMSDDEFAAGAQVDTLQESISQLYDVFDSYVKHVAKLNNGHVFNDKVQEAFKQIKDWHYLNQDGAGIVSTINILNDPKYFSRYHDIQTGIEKMKGEQKAKYLEEAMVAFEKLAQKNKFLQDLFDIGVFADPKDVAQLEKFHVVDFFDTANKQPVNPSSDLYKKILDIVDKYALAAGEQVMNKKTPEEKTDINRIRFNAIARPKFKEDKRTYADHAKQFGFDPNSEKSTVPTETVLKAIIDSDFATDEEKVLARRLLTTVKPGSVITFQNTLSTPGVYNSETNETAVDPRYSSHDFASGQKGHPIEFVILHEYGHALTVDGLNTDPVFKEAISKLNALVKDYQKTPEGIAKFGQRPLYGTMNEAEFVTEALSNPIFQQLLKSVPYSTVSGKPSSAWDNFMDSLKDLLSKMLGISSSSTVLDEALYVITSKIDDMESGAPASGKAATDTATTLSPTDLITSSTPIALIKAHRPKFFTKLVDGYKAYHLDLYGKPVVGTDDQIAVSDGFKKFIIETGTASDLISEENKPNLKTGTTGPTITPTPITVTPTVSTHKYDKGLVFDLGNGTVYTVESQNDDGTYGVLVEEPGNDYFLTLTEKQLEEKTTLKPETVVEPVVTDVNDIEAKKADIEKRRQEGTNLKGTTYKGETTEKDGLKITKYSEFRPDGKRISKGGRIMTPAEFIKEYNITDQDYLDSLEGATEIRIYEVREGKDTTGISIQGTFPEGNIDMEVAGAELAALEDKPAEVVPEVNPFVASVPTGTAASPALIAKGIKLGFTKDQIDNMSIDEREEIRLASSKEDVQDLLDKFIQKTSTKSFMDEYDSITNKEELDQWDQRALEALADPDIKAKLEETGVILTADLYRQLMAEKENELGSSLNFNDLQPGKSVLMTDGRTVKIVLENNGKDVTLVSPENFKNGTGKTIIAKSEIKKLIKMMNGDFIEAVDQEPILTAEQIADSKKAVEAATTIEDPEEISKELDAAIEADPTALNNDLAAAIKQCKL